MPKNDITLKEYNYDTRQTEELGTVSLYTLRNSITNEQLAELIGDYLNGHSPVGLAKAMAANMVENHRTLQHEAVHFLLATLVEYSAQYEKAWHGSTDPRNAGAVAAADTIRRLAQDDQLNIGPMI